MRARLGAGLGLSLVAALLPAMLAAQSNASVAPPAPPDVAGPPLGAIRTTSGLAYRVLRPGTGAARARPTSTVEVHYSGWTTDGRLFDSSRTRGAPAQFPLSGTIAGFAEGVTGMAVGEVRRVWIPEALAYGPSGPIPGMLVFEIELVRIVTP